MKRLFTLLMILTTLNVFAQQGKSLNDRKFDLRMGMGYLFLGSGDYSGVNFENEFNYRISEYFTAAASVSMGRSTNGAFDGTASFIGGNLNIFLSPFRNNRFNDFRIGGGFSFYNIADVYVSGIYYDDGAEYKDYTSTNETTVGGSVIIEDTFNINNRFLIGMKVLMQPYANGDINSGVMVKFGVKL